MLQTAARELIDILNAMGIHATTDPRNLSIPGALIAPETITINTLGTGVDIEWEVWLVAPDNGAPLVTLDPLLTPLVENRLAARFETLTLTLANQSSAPLPAIRTTLTTTTEVTQ